MTAARADRSSWSAAGRPLPRRQGRSPLLRALITAVARPPAASIAATSGESRQPAVDASLASIYDGSALRRVGGALPRIAVVGAGLAGLNAARILRDAGCPTEIFDAGVAAGGRVRTDRGTLAPGLVSELGGEFIDSQHADMLALAARFALPLLDTRVASESALATTYFFGGRHRSEAEVVAAFRDLAPRIAIDAAALSPCIRADVHTPTDVAFDRLPLSGYLDRIGASGWLRTLLEVAFTTEFGLEPDEQTCLSFLSMIDTDTSQGFSVFGDSDERYKIAGGNILLVERLMAPLGDALNFDHRLVRIAQAGQAYRLDFARSSTATRTVDADIVLLALPFSTLRQVDLSHLMPPEKQACIDQLGYGTNAKIIVGTTERVWRNDGRSGDFFTDLSMQNGWDASRLRGGEAGALTFYLGGAPGVACGEGSVSEQSTERVRSADAMFDGLLDAASGRALRAHWPSEPFAKGSYAGWRPGQQTTLVGREGTSVGRIHFAGEHCSDAFQGYMNGAAESGRIAALRIIDSLT